jgi:uncharacterized protein (TIGR00255 family)
LAWNRDLLVSYVSAFREAAAELGVAGEPDLNVMLGLPGMFRDTACDEPGEAVAALVAAAMEEAVAELNAFREREGAALAEELLRRSAAIRARAGRMEELRGQAVAACHARLMERVSGLLDGAALDPQRLAQEVALLADRSDISEELTRLRLHAEELEALLQRGGEVGKRLDFLLQEMAREANTILSKSIGTGEPGMAITALALDVKTEIEKVKEQSLNLE